MNISSCEIESYYEAKYNRMFEHDKTDVLIDQLQSKGIDELIEYLPKEQIDNFKDKIISMIIDNGWADE